MLLSQWWVQHVEMVFGRPGHIEGLRGRCSAGVCALRRPSEGLSSQMHREEWAQFRSRLTFGEEGAGLGQDRTGQDHPVMLLVKSPVRPCLVGTL